MLCPQCNTRNPLGSRRCRACHHPFTRGAAERAAQFAAPTSATTATTSGTTSRDDWTAAHDEWADRARSGDRRQYGGCALALGIVAIMAVAGLVGLLALSNFVIKPMVRDAAVREIQSGVRVDVQDEIETQLDDAPDGDVTVTEAEINEQISASDDLGPLNDIGVTLNESGIEVQLRAYGISGAYHVTPRVENGVVVLEDGDVSGPLSLVVPTADLESALNQELAAALQASGYEVDQLALGEGFLTLTLVR
jgi:hypothetical protein